MNGTVIDNKTIVLTSGEIANVTFTLIPTIGGNKNYSISVVPVAGEAIIDTLNNRLNETVFIRIRPVIVVNPEGFDFTLEMGQIGTDTFFREGSSFGIIFQAQDSIVLGEHLQKMRIQFSEEEVRLWLMRLTG